MGIQRWEEVRGVIHFNIQYELVVFLKLTYYLTYHLIFILSRLNNIVPQQQQQQQQQSQQQQKHDIFVGNLAFNTTEEQLHTTFSEIGRVIKVRMVTDVETGKPRGFAFVEFEDPQAALSAIRNMNEYELNGRRLRVNFSNSSHLEALAGKLGMDLTQTPQRTSGGGGSSSTNNNNATNIQTLFDHNPPTL